MLDGLFGLEMRQVTYGRDELQQHRIASPGGGGLAGEDMAMDAARDSTYIYTYRRLVSEDVGLFDRENLTKPIRGAQTRRLLIDQ